MVGAASLATVATTISSSAASAAAGAPGTVFVANYGGMGGSGMAATGSVTSYRPDATGNTHALGTISAKVNAPQGLTFDSSGDLWVANSNTNTVCEYTKSELALASPAPSVTISSDPSGDLNTPGGLAFDSSGDLWVANTGVTTVVEYTRSQLAKTGSPTPRATISNASFNTPFGVAFDSSGDLWVSDNAQPGSPAVFKYTKSELAKASPAPSVTIALQASPDGDDTRSGLAFDPRGDLWVVNSGGYSLVEFTKSDLAKAKPTPSVTISSNALENAPDDIIFDSSGDLWVANTGNNTIDEYTRSELAKSGSPAPSRTITGQRTGLNAPMSVAIEP
jgi:sugar lactone lactonase YvrE